MKLNLKGR